MTYEVLEGWRLGSKALDVYMNDGEEVWLIGDLHFGYETTRQEIELFKAVLKAGKKKNARFIFFGDMMEFDIPSHMTNKGVMWSQGLSPKQQRQELTKMLKPYKDNIICLISGNHENRSSDRVEDNPLDRIAEVLDVPYAPVSAWIRFIVYNNSEKDPKEETYHAYVIHGKGGSQNPKYALRKEIERKRMLGDLIAMAHIHRLYGHEFLCRYVDCEGFIQERIIVGVRTGGFLRDAAYAAERSMEHADCGYVRVWFDTDKRKVHHYLERL